eukprot:1255788-Rhodomonas_salina.1
MSGTDLACAATHCLRDVRVAHDAMPYDMSATSIAYGTLPYLAVSGTGIAHGAIPYAISGTSIAYGTMRMLLSPTYRMVQALLCLCDVRY